MNNIPDKYEHLLRCCYYSKRSRLIYKDCCCSGQNNVHNLLR